MGLFVRGLGCQSSKTKSKYHPLHQCAFVRLTYMAFKADLKARMQCHELEAYYRCRKVCDRCDAIQPFSSKPEPMTYKNTSPTAPWVLTCKDHHAYIKEAKYISPWSVVQGWQFETISFDMMHLVFLGFARNHVPSCLKILKLWGYHYNVGETDEDFLKKVSFEMKQDCKDHKPLESYWEGFDGNLSCSLF